MKWYFALLRLPGKRMKRGFRSTIIWKRSFLKPCPCDQPRKPKWSILVTPYLLFIVGHFSKKKQKNLVSIHRHGWDLIKPNWTIFGGCQLKSCTIICSICLQNNFLFSPLWNIISQSSARSSQMHKQPVFKKSLKYIRECESFLISNMIFSEARVSNLSELVDKSMSPVERT